MSSFSRSLTAFSLVISNHFGMISSHSYGESLDNHCVGKEDGDYWFLLSSDSDNINNYDPVYLRCSSEHVILDVSKDDTLTNYFSSFEKWHYAIGGPKNSDPSNWNEWFLPETSETNYESSYYISPDCNTCDISHEMQVFDSETTYWMTGNLAKLFWQAIGFSQCDMDQDTYQCYDCQSCLLATSENLDAETCEPIEFEVTEDDYHLSGICGVAVQAASSITATTRRDGESPKYDGYHYKPSIGTDGRFCVCYQPSSDSQTSFTLTEEQEEYIEEREELLISNTYNSVRNSLEKSDNDGHIYYSRVDGHDIGDASDSIDLRDSNIVYLNKNDFKDGTLRIRKSGTYVITEDIEFDFCKENDYWPLESQADDYPGAAKFRDAYSFGFFAGIAVEADFVTIDLNGFELKQSIEFYFNQRWFAVIELGNQQFLPGQGPAFFGAQSINVKHVSIKNGILGLSAHFGIHGNFPQDISIENVHIRDFVTHGVQLNGWEDLYVNDVEIGPSSTVDYLKGEFGHARLMLQRLERVRDTMSDSDMSTKKVSFANKDSPSTIDDLINDLKYEMEVAYDYAINRINGKYEDTDYVNPKYLNSDDYESMDDAITAWEKIKGVYIQESGFPAGSSISGMFLNYYGASVFAYAKYVTTDYHSKNGVLNNVYVHDLTHEMSETVRIATRFEGGQLYTTPWASNVPGHMAFGTYDKMIEYRDFVVSMEDTSKTMTDDDKEKLWNDFTYDGNALVSSYIGIAALSDDWDMLGMLEVSDQSSELTAWAAGTSTPGANWRFGCNEDIMQHSGKGVLGLRMDGVTNVQLTGDIKIENLYDKTGLGTMACGEYEGPVVEGEGGQVKQKSPMQVGFSGNNLQGISITTSTNVNIYGNIEISNIFTDYGEVFGLSFWTGNDITIDESAFIKVKNVQAGLKLDQGSFSYDSRPNRSPEACGVRLEIDDSDDVYKSNINVKDSDKIIVCGVTGHETCLGENDDTLTMFGTYLSDDYTVCESVNNAKDVRLFLDAINENGMFLNTNNNMFMYVLAALGVMMSVALLVYFCNGFCQSESKNNNNEKWGNWWKFGSTKVQGYYLLNTNANSSVNVSVSPSGNTSKWQYGSI